MATKRITATYVNSEAARRARDARIAAYEARITAALTSQVSK